ncbi:MAG: redoxin domain-containing protein [Bacteroidales bacterium]|nr:redoxin domain-containing protein [Bacteroidales bacterium]
MQIIKQLLAVILFITLSLGLYAQKDAYNINVKLNNSTDTSLLLVSYYGNTNMKVDTAYLHKNSYTFSGKDTLNGGIYLVVFQNKQYFEIIVDEDQHFSVETDPNDPINKMQVKGSDDNTDFYNYLKEINVYGRKSRKLSEEYKAAEGNTEKTNEIREKITVVNNDVKNEKLKFIKEHEGSLFSKVLLASQEPEIPTELPLNEDGTPDSTFIYRYYKEHFFDNFDFADERLLRTPIYASKIERYFKKVIVQRPDTLIKETIAIIEKAKPNKETYKYTIWYFTYQVETSKIMGMDAVFVALGKKYYLTGEAYWVSEGTMKRMTKRINTLDRLLVGKPAPNLIMQDTNMQLKSLYDIKANYTLIIFWDPDCGHCKHEVNSLKRWYDENADKYGLQIFSVCSDTSVVKWKKKIHEYKIYDWVNVDGPRSLTENYHDLYDIISTPTIYLLDDKKKIITKRLSAAQNTSYIKRLYDTKEAKK